MILIIDTSSSGISLVLSEESRLTPQLGVASPPYWGGDRPKGGRGGSLYSSEPPLSQAAPDCPSPAGGAQECYLEWEINLLKELGYALDLTRCSGCGKAEELTHLSPRTARAVCSECAAPYLDKLFELPVDLNITKKFLEKILTEQGGKSLPQTRNLLTV